MRFCYFKKLIVFILFITSCIPEEVPVPKHTVGELITRQIDLGINYDYQIFYNLKEDVVVAENIKESWDVGFNASPQGWEIILNSSKFMKAAYVSDILFEDVSSVNNLVWRYDNSRGIFSGTAIGDYRNKNFIYILDLGVGDNGNQLGYKKLRIDTVNNDAYIIRYSNLDNTQDTTIQITKNDNFNFIYLSLSDNSSVEIEPRKDNWDLLFSRYTTLLIDSNNDTIPYLVTGVLINYLINVEVVLDTNLSFNDINYELTSEYNFNNQQDIIGYDWKYYDFSTQNYIVNQEKNYVIKNQNGIYFKLRFIDYYNQNGDKGSPKFELQQL